MRVPVNCVRMTAPSIHSSFEIHKYWRGRCKFIKRTKCSMHSRNWHRNKMRQHRMDHPIRREFPCPARCRRNSPKEFNITVSRSQNIPFSRQLSCDMWYAMCVMRVCVWPIQLLFNRQWVRCMWLGHLAHCSIQALSNTLHTIDCW